MTGDILHQSTKLELLDRKTKLLLAIRAESPSLMAELDDINDAIAGIDQKASQRRFAELDAISAITAWLKETGVPAPRDVVLQGVLDRGFTPSVARRTAAGNLKRSLAVWTKPSNSRLKLRNELIGIYEWPDSLFDEQAKKPTNC